MHAQRIEQCLMLVKVAGGNVTFVPQRSSTVEQLDTVSVQETREDMARARHRYC